MNDLLTLLEDKRARLLALTTNLSVEQYNSIPDGFNNNIIWNMGHTLAVAENYLYSKNGLPRPAHVISLAEYERGTRPILPLSAYQIDQIRTLLAEPVNFSVEIGDQQAKSNDAAVFMISEKSVNFVLFHDDYHYNSILAILSAMGVL